MEYSVLNGTSISHPFPQGSRIIEEKKSGKYQNERQWMIIRKEYLLDTAWQLHTLSHSGYDNIQGMNKSDKILTWREELGTKS